MLVKFVNVSNFPIDEPIPISIYGATQGIGARTLPFPPINNAFDVAFSLVRSLLMSFPSELVKIKPAYGLSSNQEAAFRMYSPCRKRPPATISALL